jgi:hypothetical protein
MPHVPSDELHPLNLEQLKKQAKELSRMLAAGDRQALARFRAHHPKARGLTDEAVHQCLARITEAQLVIARELGLSTWPRLRDHIDRHRSARAAVAAGASVLDGEMATIHVRCGIDIQEDLKRAGLQGDFLEFFDPVCQGPVPRVGDLLEVRAGFVASAYGIPAEQARADLARQLQALDASRAAERVVLWFEHDTFDQLILARILGFYAEHGGPRRLELVQVNRFPGVDRFKGLGELSAAALRMLWEDRRPVGTELLDHGLRVWNALRDPSPMELFRLVHRSELLPAMGPALLRHLQELPWRSDGLSLTERAALTLAADGPVKAGDMFVRLSALEYPVHLGLGDSMFAAILERLAGARAAPIAIRQADAAVAWHKEIVALTSVGRLILDGELDYLSTGPVERWVGGVRIVGGTSAWRWDPAGQSPVTQGGEGEPAGST